MNRDLDDPILEWLFENEGAFPPAVIRYNLRTRHDVEIPKRTMSHRLGLLEEGGLVEKEREKGGYYSITDKGRRYLQEEASSDELEMDTE